MGKEWYWGGSKSANSKREGDKDATHCTTSTTTPSGCMSAVFQFFDFHHFQFPLHQQQSSFKPGSSSVTEGHTILKGVEAPRNSLELEKTPLSSTCVLKEEEIFNIPMGIQIKTSCGHLRSKVGSSASNDSSSEISSSPGAKTPNLVARLMGLDLLPESHSPSSSSCHQTPKSNLHHLRRLRQSLHGKPVGYRNSIDVDITGTRSLPETPRISTARRSDVDLHHRLSLRINKENVGVGEELDFSRFSYLKRKELKQEDENRSPSHYTRQITKQVKENVNRKVGVDITNTLRNREQTRDGDQLSPLNSKKSSRVLSKVVVHSSAGKHSTTPSCSQSKQKAVTSTVSTKDDIPRQSRKSLSSSPPSQAGFIHPLSIQVLSTKSKLKPLQEQEHHSHNHDQQRPAKKFKKVVASERFSQKIKKPPQTTDIIKNKQEEPFIRPSTANRVNRPDKKSKKTPLSSDLLNITVPTLLPVKKDPSPPATKLPQKQVFNAQISKRNAQLYSNSVQTYKQEATQTLVIPENIDNRASGIITTTTAEGGAENEYEYVTRILRRTGIDKDSPVSFTQWFSPAHPLDPSIFHHLENVNNPTISSNQLPHHCDRKLLFELVDEILVDILKPYIKMKPWIPVSRKNIIGRDYDRILQGSDLIDTLCMQIKRFPCADCRVLEDIDALIDKDFRQMKVQREMAFEEEGEGVVMEIGKDILDTLILETVVEFAICGQTEVIH